MTTRAPRSIASAAMARPIPRADPVTRTRWNAAFAYLDPVRHLGAGVGVDHGVKARQRVGRRTQPVELLTPHGIQQRRAFHQIVA